ncbi:sulfurtransferase [Brevibacillus composti]|uniref:Sulfurtransferase n=1 Tax=Brevibacillus composti TaxID=2796470 RepID=A0A7T5JMC5_9BACL|nr:sulfurtransferase [Brevibacillus composti]QQE72974.1 sulfurtransferase [Brevibacillus composti]QUO40052.1 sulfurtransferase [Brevibacillus composti]
MQALVSAQWLHEHLEDPQILVVDCRYNLSEPSLGEEQYGEEHIPGALYFHLGRDLSGTKGEHGGRHPVPDVEQLASLFSRAGIDQDVTVIAYDDQDMSYAGRLWWLLRYAGHEKVAVLDGGLSAWKRAGYAVTKEVPVREPRTFVPQLQAHMLVDCQGVQTRDEQAALLDSRALERYRGEVEPLDPKAGHIPGALHYFYKENLTAEGCMRPSEELKRRFDDLEGKEIIVYCGSGVTACTNLLALHAAGRTDAKLYAGSWSDWVSYADNPVATGDE